METLKFIFKFFVVVFLCAMAAVSTGGILLIPAMIVIIGYVIHYLVTPSKAEKAQKPGIAHTAPPPSASPACKVCRHCGAQNALDGIYCEVCGYKLP